MTSFRRWWITRTYTSRIHTWAYLKLPLDRSRSQCLRETSHDGKYADRGTPGGMHFEAHCLESEDEPEGIEAMEATPGTASSPSRWKHCSPVLQSLSESQSPPPAAHGEDVVQPESPLFTATAGSTKHRECKDSERLSCCALMILAITHSLPATRGQLCLSGFCEEGITTSNPPLMTACSL